LIYW